MAAAFGFPWQFDPSMVRITPLNLWGAVLLFLFLAHLYLSWRFLRPDRDGVKRYLYELVSSVDGRGRERADLRKLGACFFMLLASFLLVRGALVGVVDQGSLAQTYGFISVLLAIGIPVANNKAAVEIAATQAQADATKALTDLLPKPVQKVEAEIVNSAANPVITQDSQQPAAGADVPLPGN